MSQLNKTIGWEEIRGWMERSDYNGGQEKGRQPIVFAMNICNLIMKLSG